MDTVVPRINFKQIYKQYDFLLKKTFHDEPEIVSKSKRKNNTHLCYGTNLKKSDYQKYKRDKTNITVYKCRNIIPDSEKFCSVHQSLCNFLHEKTIAIYSHHFIGVCCQGGILLPGISY